MYYGRQTEQHLGSTTPCILLLQLTPRLWSLKILGIKNQNTQKLTTIEETENYNRDLFGKVSLSSESRDALLHNDAVTDILHI
jgi:hypothetical protein